MRRTHTREQGAAMVIVLLLTVLAFILVTSMLSVAGTEVVIAGLQRDGIRALDLAEAGLTEALRRIEKHRPYASFAGSLDPTRVAVTVTTRFSGLNSAYHEIQSTATVGRARRRLSLLVLEYVTSLGNVVLADAITASEGGYLKAGDAYAQTHVVYTMLPISASALTYAGWRIRSGPADSEPAFGPCSTRAHCLQLAQDSKYDTIRDKIVNFYPGTRRGVPEATARGAEIAAQTDKCVEGEGGALPSMVITGALATDPCTPACTPVTIDVFGFDTDDPDGSGPAPAQAVTATLPCGLPYKYEPVTFQDESGNALTRLFKTIVYDQWFETYWRFDESELIHKPGQTLTAAPQFGVIPPMPDFSALERRPFDLTVEGAQTIGRGAYDLGCKMPEMTGEPFCFSSIDEPKRVHLNDDGGGRWALSALHAHGLIVVDAGGTGQLSMTGVEHWGAVVVNGSTVGRTTIVHGGGLINSGTLTMAGALELDTAPTFATVDVGRSFVIRKSWWER